MFDDLIQKTVRKGWFSIHEAVAKDVKANRDAYEKVFQGMISYYAVEDGNVYHIFAEWDHFESVKPELDEYEYPYYEILISGMVNGEHQLGSVIKRKNKFSERNK
jgi:hypothetical protein